MFDLTDFTIKDMLELGAALRNLGPETNNMDEVANRVVHYLYEHLIDKQSGQRSCALVRFYKTYSYGALDAELRQFADALLGYQPDAAARMKCLTLLATVGEKSEWNSRSTSVGHKAIPLPSEQVVSQLPMIAQLVKQFGLEINTLVGSAPELIVEAEQHTFNVFHVPEALGSPFVPAQEDFVIPYGIKSVLGFGGMLPSGDLFVVIMFSKVPIARETADMFTVVALNIKVALLFFTEEVVFN